jgi:Ca2+-binding EF-hand superfamily protein
MRNYTLLFSFLLLFFVSDLDAQRSKRSSGRIDKTEIEQSNEKGSKELHKAYGFESKEEMKDFLLDKDLKRKDRRIVEKYGKGKKLSKGQIRRLEQLLEEHSEDRGSVQTSSRSGRIDGASRSSGRDRRGEAVRGKSGRIDGASRSSGRDRRGEANRNLSRSGRQEAQNDQGPSFEEVDSNNDGEISYSEAQAVFGQEPDFDERFNEADLNNDGNIDMGEWEAVDDRDRDDEGGPPFEEVDANGDGEISREEARAFFGDEPNFDAEYDNVDSDNNGSVDPQEYEAADDGDRDGEHNWYCQICDMHFDSGEAMDDHAQQMGHTNADFDCDPNHDYPQMDPGPDGGCADYADCNGNGLFDVGEPCYEGDGHDGPPPFEEVDANGDGEISREEARAFFGDEPNFDAEYDNVDSDNNGSVDPQEYEAADDGDQNDG